MASEAQQNKILEGKSGTIERLENLHPYQMLMYLGILASVLIFMFMIVAFSIRAISYDNLDLIEFPKAFTLSTLILLYSGIRINRLLSHYEKENLGEIFRRLQITLILGFIFLVGQIMGWYLLFQEGWTLASDLSAAYLYVISGLHMIHLLGGIIYLIVLNIQVYLNLGNEIKELIYFTNQFQKLKLKLLITYWRFLDFSWLVIYLWFFLIF
jgi:cytochrome c oxidase subunit 3